MIAIWMELLLWLCIIQLSVGLSQHTFTMLRYSICKLWV